MNKNVAAQFLAMLQGAIDAPVAVNRKRPAKGKNAKRTKGKGQAKASEAEIEASRLRNNELVTDAFTKAGFTDVQPRINVLTYDKWVEQGRRVRKGEKSTRVGNFNLFHVSQTDADAPAAEAAAPQ